jgi:hypothetical protein
MDERNLPTNVASSREVYEAPRVLEDLPLESFSLACDPGKSDPQCEAEGGVIST